MAEEIFHFNHGAFKCIIFNEKNRQAPASTMYASVADNERERVTAEFGLDDTIPSAINILYIDTGREKVLIDTGLGQGALYAGLEQVGIDRADINHIVVTHGHGDHIGGILDADDNLMFPNAQYWVGKVEWEGWDGSGDSYSELQGRVRKAIGDRVHLLETEVEFMSGFAPMFIPGHCKGMIGVVIQSDGERILHIADVMHHILQVKYPDWCVNFDRDKPNARISRRRVLQRATDENLLIVSYHVWKSGRGYIQPDGDTWAWQWVD